MQNFCFEHENLSFYRTQHSHMQSWIVSSLSLCISSYLFQCMCMCVCVRQTVSWCCFLSILASKQNKRKSTTATANDEPQQLIIKLIWFNTRQQPHPSPSSLLLLDCSRERERKTERETGCRTWPKQKTMPNAHFVALFQLFPFHKHTNRLPASPSHTSQQTKRQSVEEGGEREREEQSTQIKYNKWVWRRLLGVLEPPGGKQATAMQTWQQNKFL